MVFDIREVIMVEHLQIRKMFRKRWPSFDCQFGSSSCDMLPARSRKWGGNTSSLGFAWRLGSLGCMLHTVWGRGPQDRNLSIAGLGFNV